MIIIGDCAYPKSDLYFENRFDEFVLLNCEGYLVEDEKCEYQGVYNSIDSLKRINDGKVVFGLANNHILDSLTGVTDSMVIAEKNEIPVVGAGQNFTDSNLALVINENDIDIAIIAAGWDVIGCKHSTENSQGVTPLKEDLILNLIKEHRRHDRKIVIYAHWGYELEIYPHPTHRDLAKTFIDAGADIILGCHAHCLQGYESYNGKPIFYGLGNAIFKENFYMGGRLTFPEICKAGLSVKWNPATGGVLVADVSLNKEKVSFSSFCDPMKNESLKELSNFQSLNTKEYIEFFSLNRRKKKLLPIFWENDNTLMYRVKCLLVHFRAYIISALFKLNLKGSSR